MGGSDADSRTLHYVEVIYLEKMMPTEVKRFHYDPEEAKRIFANTVGKFLKTGQQALVVMRRENHDLITSEAVNYASIKSKK